MANQKSNLLESLPANAPRYNMSLRTSPGAERRGGSAKATVALNCAAGSRFGLVPCREHRVSSVLACLIAWLAPAHSFFLL
mmetsp:Transcript_25799/g.73076  ORF Transcript_25799/g.73076 Transcript_25799/m.73076 type:complete len:81 (-) Transcript_25799:100-342(-)